MDSAFPLPPLAPISALSSLLHARQKITLKASLYLSLHAQYSQKFQAALLNCMMLAAVLKQRHTTSLRVTEVPRIAGAAKFTEDGIRQIANTVATTTSIAEAEVCALSSGWCEPSLWRRLADRLMPMMTRVLKIMTRMTGNAPKTKMALNQKTTSR